ncbi:MAG TPA: hypothetical protein VFR07_05200 [Mycobacteriales bacterium]|jgi:hypothetical protein|nr:hypothetical protein [Mycobacteriales bacterium]
MTRTPIRRSAVALVAGLLCAATTATAAPPASAASGGSSPGYQDRTIGSCTAYGSSSGFGVGCRGAGGSTVTLRELLRGDPVPTCWNGPPPQEFEAPPRQQPGQWWLQICLGGIDADTLIIERPGGIQLSYEYTFLPPGDETRLTGSQQVFVDAVVERGQVPLPFPLLDVSPSPTPRVGEVAAFSLIGPERTRTLTVGNVTMVGVLEGLSVQPEGAAGPTVTCTGSGRELRPEEVDTADLDDQEDDLCAYRYTRSSFGAGDDDRYPAVVTARWRVEFGDGAEPLRPFDKTAVNQLRVAEVQTLVVTGSGA